MAKPSCPTFACEIIKAERRSYCEVPGNLVYFDGCGTIITWVPDPQYANNNTASE